MKIIIAAGGTAGHINPGLAIAQHIKSKHPDAEIMFVGRKQGMEYKLVTQAGYKFSHMEVTGFQRSFSPENIKKGYNDNFTKSALSRIYTELNIYGKAEELVNEIIEQNPDNLNYLSDLAEIHIREKNYDKC